MTIGFWLSKATEALVATGVTSARLDAELLLSHTVKMPRTYLHAHIDEEIENRLLEISDARLDLRLDRVPLAYIIGHKEFFGRPFKVTPATLIPRPESEDMIHSLKDLPASSGQRVVDVGTGSGCLGITAKLELPKFDVSLVDISAHALNVAKENAKRLDASVTINRSDLLQNYPFQADMILANLPYVDPEWELSAELEHEPDFALFAFDGGLKLIKTLIDQSVTALSTNGWLLLEADTRQHEVIERYAQERGFRLHATRGLILVFTH